MQTDAVKQIKQQLETTYFGGNNYYVRDEFGTGVILVTKSVKYLTDYILFNDKETVFKKSLAGAKKLNQFDYALQLRDSIVGLDKESIIACCKLCSFDLINEINMPWYKQVDKIQPTDQAIYNIEGMTKRTVDFLKGKTILDKHIKIDSMLDNKKVYGHVDYITDDTLWNIKIISAKPAKSDIGNLLYCLETLNNPSVSKIGIFNPRQNVTYTHSVK